MQIITQETIEVGSLVLFHIDTVPYVGVVVAMVPPGTARVRVQTKNGLREIEIETSQLSARP